MVWFLGGVEIAQQAALGAERIDAGEELLQAIEGGEAFHGDQRFAALMAGIVPAFGNCGGILSCVSSRK